MRSRAKTLHPPIGEVKIFAAPEYSSPVELFVKGGKLLFVWGTEPAKSVPIVVIAANQNQLDLAQEMAEAIQRAGWLNVRSTAGAIK